VNERKLNRKHAEIPIFLRPRSDRSQDQVCSIRLAEEAGSTSVFSPSMTAVMICDTHQIISRDIRYNNATRIP
jgi:hypothetical protein